MTDDRHVIVDTRDANPHRPASLQKEEGARPPVEARRPSDSLPKGYLWTENQREGGEADDPTQVEWGSRRSVYRAQRQPTPFETTSVVASRRSFEFFEADMRAEDLLTHSTEPRVVRTPGRPSH